MSADMLRLVAVGIARASGFKISEFDWPQTLSDDNVKKGSVRRSGRLLFAEHASSTKRRWRARTQLESKCQALLGCHGLMAWQSMMWTKIGAEKRGEVRRTASGGGRSDGFRCSRRTV